MYNIYDKNHFNDNNNEPDYENNLAFNPQVSNEKDEIKKLKDLLKECYMLINHWYMPTKHQKLLKTLRKELGYD